MNWYISAPASLLLRFCDFFAIRVMKKNSYIQSYKWFFQTKTGLDDAQDRNLV